MLIGGRNAPEGSQTRGSSAHTAPDTQKKSVAPDLQRSGNLISQHDSRACPIAGSLINPASMCPDFSHTHFLLWRSPSISLFFSLSFQKCAFCLYSHTSWFSCVYLLVHSPTPWRFTSHTGIRYTHHPYLCLKCRPSCIHLFCFHTLSALCSFPDTGISCIPYLSVFLTHLLFRHTAIFSHLLLLVPPLPAHAASQLSFSVAHFSGASIHSSQEEDVSERLSSPRDPPALPHFSTHFSFFFFSFCNSLFSALLLLLSAC